MEKHYTSYFLQPLFRFALKCCFTAFIFSLAHAKISAQAPHLTDPSVFVENPDHFPSNDLFVFSRIQIPWSRDTSHYNANHDSIAVRIHNNGLNNLVITKLILSDTTSWQFVKLNGVNYDSTTSLPFTVRPGQFADLTVKFVAVDAGTRVKILHDTLSIMSDDAKLPVKTVYFNGLWQMQGEGDNEPYAQEVIHAFGYTSNTGFSHVDPDQGDTTKPKGDEILSSFFVLADTTRPVSIRQLAAYHSCCTFTERIAWYPQGSPSSLSTVFTHIAADGQSLLPRRGTSAPAQGSFTPTTPFGFEVGYVDNTDPSQNPGGKIGIRILKALDGNGNIIPNAYIFACDYIGSSLTNYDYQDNMYYVSNIKPVNGPANYSILNPTPSEIDFGERVLKTPSSPFQLKLSSLGKIYPNGTADPLINISSIKITGEDSSEFSASMPLKATLNPQDSTTLIVNFNPVTQGLKIANLLIYYNNSLSPLRVPLYGSARSPDTMVVVNYRINSGSSTPITYNGQTWEADNKYAFNNIQPFTNSHLHQIAGTDKDSLYLKEQSSDSTKRPFSYIFPVPNGDYVVRLHFAEIYWGAPGFGINGGVGSRIMNVYLENQLQLANFDVTREVGGGATALVENIPVTVKDSTLNVDFTALINRPMVVAVEVYSFRPSTILSSAAPEVYVLPEANKLTKPKVYPNPLHKTFMIEFPSTYSGNSTLQITDALGRIYSIGQVKLQRGRSNNTQIDVSTLPLKPGVYYLRVLSETRPSDVIKLVIE